MTTNILGLARVAWAIGLVLSLRGQAFAEASLKQTMDGIVSRLYVTLDEKGLSSLTNERIWDLITDEEREVLATKYWYFDVDVPVVVSVIRNVDQPVTPAWIEKAGFKKTDLVAKNEIWSYEIWQKEFPPGRVELGINGFDMHRTVYFVCVGPQQAGAKVNISNLFPAAEAVATMKRGASTYRDWDELVIEQLPESLEGQLLLTTYRGRAREAHLIGAFRKTPFPSSAMPDHVVLTWSDDPRTTQTIQWRTGNAVKRGGVRYRARSATDHSPVEVQAERALIEDRLLMNDRYTHRFTAVLSGLKPSTTYAYRVGSPDTNHWTDEAQFTTAPDGDLPFSFVYFGDTHRAPEWGRMLHAADQHHPDIAFYTIAGDIVSTGLFRDEWDHLFEYSSGVFERKPLAFSLGNHDDQDGLGAWMPLALVEFPDNGPQDVEPERTYSFRYSNALFLVCDVGTPYDVQARWMEEQLANSDATWKFVIYHFPMYDVNSEDEYGAIRRRWEKVFAQYQVDFMLQGHVHHYLRTRPMKNGHLADASGHGTVYVISVALPGRERTLEPAPYVAKYLSGGPWYQKIDIAGKRLVFRAYNAEHEICDQFTIEKSP